jgi:hypothetical protein
MSEITLKHPIIVNDEMVHVLTFPDRLKLKDMRAMDSAPGEIGKLGALIGSLAKLPTSAVDQIDAEDIEAIAEVIGGFLPQFRQIGGM